MKPAQGELSNHLKCSDDNVLANSSVENLRSSRNKMYSPNITVAEAIETDIGKLNEMIAQKNNVIVKLQDEIEKLLIAMWTRDENEDSMDGAPTNNGTATSGKNLSFIKIHLLIYF